VPWKEGGVVNERMLFVTRVKDGERMVDLCREFQISRKTGYKIFERYERLGALGLLDESRRPVRSPQRTPKETAELIIAVRKKHPTWGPLKIRSWLVVNRPGIKLPAPSTIGDLLHREGLVQPRRRKRSTPPNPSPLTLAHACNEVWCVDFKGQFRLGNGRYCYPLTITDLYSRYIIACEALEKPDEASARPVFEMVFRKFGLPKVIRSDNGVPFATRGIAGLSRLSAWWLRLCVQPERIKPGHPEQNGQHERMHRTLKAETTRPAAQNILQQQERFDRFVAIYDEERPHEALGLVTPASIYVPSERAFPDPLPELQYPLHDLTRTVSASGHIHLFGRRSRLYLSAASWSADRTPRARR
jgi:transposase InsO family protein